MTDLLHDLLGPSKALAVQAHKANRVTLANLERLTAFQMDALQAYVDLGGARLKAAMDIHDLGGLITFQANHLRLLMTLYEKLIADARALADLGVAFKAELDRAGENEAAPPQTAQAPSSRKAA
ncbi:phasin family protein [Chelatococcus sp. SYSU_G07232]|uniref:Phasin family protein n=1 Tax=Chelatococcus albus TaxID=3047466 RepID=A0ABT7ALN0_9HYPH|nr:phasin family protein [Chelatococcus sp. SYSU_G07232]MDJ1160287.1 phasin family protein [Chelatococcus sp. SYSU_G07232]